MHVGNVNVTRLALALAGLITAILNVVHALTGDADAGV